MSENPSERKCLGDAEIKSLAIQSIDMIRPMHLRICDVRRVLHCAIDALEYIVLREKTE